MQNHQEIIKVKEKRTGSMGKESKCKQKYKYIQIHNTQNMIKAKTNFYFFVVLSFI